MMKLPRQSKVRVAICIALMTIALTLFFLPRLTDFYYTTMEYYYLADMLYHQKTFQRGWFNDRLDRIAVVTHWSPPFLSTFTFKPGNSETETTLLTVKSKTLWANVTWRDENHVEVSLILDPGATIGGPLDKVGKVQIAYSFAYRNKSTSRPPGWIRMNRGPLF